MNGDNPTVVTTCLDVVSCNNINTLFTTGWYHFLLCLINTGRITLFSCSTLCFEVYTYFIFLITVWWRQNIKSDCFMVCFKNFPVFWYLGKFIYFHFYWPRKCLIFVILCRFFPVWFSAAVIAYWKHVLLLFRRIYVLSTTVETYKIIFLEQSLDIIKQKITALHGLFQTYLTPMQKGIRKLFNYFICIIFNHKFFVITFQMHQLAFTIIFCWYEFYFHYINFLLVRCSRIIYHVSQVLPNFLKVLTDKFFSASLLYSMFVLNP